MHHERTGIVPAASILLVLIGVMFACRAAAQPADDRGAGGAPPAETEKQSLLDYIEAGGPVGVVIIVLSFAGVAMVVDGFRTVSESRLLPDGLVTQLGTLARQGKFSDLRATCKANTSMIARIVGGGLDEGRLGIDAVREEMQDLGSREVTRLHQRVGYIGFIASIAPMLGLLGTVTGMIGSFNVLGVSKGAARPDQLATGVSEALVTTCMGLVVALPLMFFHNLFRDRVTRVGQHASGICDKIIRMATIAQAIADSGQTPGADAQRKDT